MGLKTFELMAGRHVCAHPTMKRPDDGLPEDELHLALDHTDPMRPVPHPSRFVQSELDLEERHPGKFRKVDEREEETIEQLEARLAEMKKAQLPPVAAAPPATASSQQTPVAQAAKQGFDTIKLDRLDTMSVQELVKLAEEEEFDLKGISRDKGSLLKFLKQKMAK